MSRDPKAQEDPKKQFLTLTDETKKQNKTTREKLMEN